MLSARERNSDQAMSGVKALALINERISKVKAGEAEMYKLLMLDYSMPEMDGPQVATEIRKLLSEANITQPIICCCTAYECSSY